MPLAFIFPSFEVHVIRQRCHHAIKVAWIQLNLVVEPLSVAHFDGPSPVEFGDQMVALGVVDAIPLPALVEVVP